jgi:hypothetical protein
MSEYREAREVGNKHLHIFSLSSEERESFEVTLVTHIATTTSCIDQVTMSVEHLSQLSKACSTIEYFVATTLALHTLNYTVVAEGKYRTFARTNYSSHITNPFNMVLLLSAACLVLMYGFHERPRSVG